MAEMQPLKSPSPMPAAPLRAALKAVLMSMHGSLLSSVRSAGDGSWMSASISVLQFAFIMSCMLIS